MGEFTRGCAGLVLRAIAVNFCPEKFELVGQTLLAFWGDVFGTRFLRYAVSAHGGNYTANKGGNQDGRRSGEMIKWTFIQNENAAAVRSLLSVPAIFSDRALNA